MATDHFTQSPASLPDSAKILDPFAELLDAYEAISLLSDFEYSLPEITIIRSLNKNFRMLLDSPESQPYLS